jgi:deoxyribose-phosphate aldolase
MAESQELDEIIRLVTEELLDQLGSGARAGTGAADSACPDCDGRCVARCIDRTRNIVNAGAARISSAAGTTGVERALAALIDHTLLKPEASRAEIEALCTEAVRYGFASVCVNPCNVPLAAELTRGSSVKVCTVVGFPLGATLTSVKLFETEEALKLGAQEIDMVQNVGALKSLQDEQVEADIRAVVDLAHAAGAICKVILETALLTTEEKVRAALIAKDAGADFVKTSTGFSSSGASAEDVALLRASVGSQMGIKAAGGIRNLDDVLALVDAGATRIGASASIRIIEQSAGANTLERA